MRHRFCVRSLLPLTVGLLFTHEASSQKVSKDFVTNNAPQSSQLQPNTNKHDSQIIKDTPFDPNNLTESQKETLKVMEELEARGLLTEQIRMRLINEELNKTAAVKQKRAKRPWTFPGISAGSPTGYGADWGSVFAGVSVQPENAYGKNDAAAGLGFGLLNSRKWVGVEVSADFLSIYKDSRKPKKAKNYFTTSPDFDTGAGTVKVHRALPWGMGFAIGRENLYRWGTYKDVTPQSWYGVVSKIFHLTRYSNQWFSALTVTTGLGNSRFLNINDFRAQKNKLNLFGSAALRVHQPLSLIVDWSGNVLNTGASIAPFRTWPIVANILVVDVSGQFGPKSRMVFSLGGGFNFN